MKLHQIQMCIIYNLYHYQILTQNVYSQKKIKAKICDVSILFHFFGSELPRAGCPSRCLK
jgi:hypothetical protein